LCVVQVVGSVKGCSLCQKSSIGRVLSRNLAKRRPRLELGCRATETRRFRCSLSKLHQSRGWSLSPAMDNCHCLLSYP